MPFSTILPTLLKLYQPIAHYRQEKWLNSSPWEKIGWGEGVGLERARAGSWAVDLKLSMKQECDVLVKTVSKMSFLKGRADQGQGCPVPMLRVVFRSGHHVLHVLFLISKSNLCSLQKI